MVRLNLSFIFLITWKSQYFYSFNVSFLFSSTVPANILVLFSVMIIMVADISILTVIVANIYEVSLALFWILYKYEVI